VFNYNFYHGTIRRYIVLFGTLFNQIYITRTDDEGTSTSQIRVPITYGPKDKVLARATMDPNLDRPFGSIVPYITFEMIRMYYDTERHLATQGREVGPNSTNKDLANWTYNPVAYNRLFEMNVIVKNAEDGVKILEQILPFFTPSWTAKVQLIDDPVIIKDVPVTLLDHSTEDSWEGNFENRRYLAHTLRFEMKGYLFGPVERSKIIKKFEGNFGPMNPDGSLGGLDAQVAVTPGLTANGEPTSDPNETVPYEQINWEDDFGYITTTTIIDD
jgi:hypothetical protein